MSIPPKHNMELYYFSGTGNSLHVALELQRRFVDAELIPMLRAIKGQNLKSHAEVAGLVFPIQAFAIPRVVERFIERIDLGSARYLFAVATRECSDRAFSDLNLVLARQGRSLDASFGVEMVCNYIPVFRIPPKEKIARMEPSLQNRLDEIFAVVSERRRSRVKDGPLVFLLGHCLYPPITRWYQQKRFPDMARSFFADDRCTGCGTCAQVCLSDRIGLVDGKPHWNDADACLYCFACLHYCPSHAVQIRGRKTHRRGRYHHADISVKSLVQQKE